MGKIFIVTLDEKEMLENPPSLLWFVWEKQGSPHKVR